MADPEEYPNLFEDWQVALAVESKAAETRCVGKCVDTLFCNLYNLCTKHFQHVFDKLTLFFYYRGVYHPAEEYVNHANKAHVTLVDAFRNMQIEEGDHPLENGDSNHEVY